MFDFKEDIITAIIAIIIFILIVWFMVSQPTLIPQSSRSKIDHIQVENLKKHLYTIVEKFDDRGYRNTEVLNATANYIHSEFAKYSDEVEYQTYHTSWNFEDEIFEYKNVIANFKGRDSCEGIIVVGAHYDTFGGHAGANDNTSGVVGLLELARVLKDHPPKCDVEIVAYTLEEPPAFATEKMGSFIHAKHLQEQGIKVKIAIVLDMIGFYSDEKNSQIYPVPFMDLYYPSRANFISVIGNFSNIKEVREVKSIMKSTSNLPIYSINAPALISGIDFSDHRNYWRFGYPAVMISDTAFYRSDNYHTPKDTPNTLNYENMAKVIEGVFKVISKMH